MSSHNVKSLFDIYNIYIYIIYIYLYYIYIYIPILYIHIYVVNHALKIVYKFVYTPVLYIYGLLCVVYYHVLLCLGWLLCV